MIETKHRVEDALAATQAAMEEGIVVGGGVALIRASEHIKELEDKEENVGAEIVKKAIESPLYHIASNAGHVGDVVVGIVKGYKKNEGFNAATGEYEDLMKGGVIDPAKVTRTAIENASSIAGMFLTTEVIIAQNKDEDKDKQQGQYN
jgi:chaperonin GroEL